MLKVYYQFSRYNDDGLIRRSRKKLSRSFVKQFMQMMYVGLKTYATTTATDSINTSRVIYYPYQFVSVHPGGNAARFWANEGNYVGLANMYKVGIHVGTGTSAVGMTDAALATEIDNGTGAGELEYLSCHADNYTISAPNATFTLERYFRNSSGDSIDINEVGVYSTTSGQTTSIYSLQIIRDLVAPAETVADGEYLKVTYTFQVSV